MSNLGLITQNVQWLLLLGTAFVVSGRGDGRERRQAWVTTATYRMSGDRGSPAMADTRVACQA